MIELITKQQKLELNAIGSSSKEIYEDGYSKGKAEGYAEGLPVGIEQGRQAENEDFWNTFTNNGKRTNYQYAFWYWGNEYITPTRAIVPTDKGSLYHTFAFNSNLKEIRKGKFDFSQKERGTNNQQGFNYTFQGCSNLTIIEDIGIKAEHQIIQAFSECYALHTIEVLRIAENTALNTNIFRNASKLANITIEGTIGQNNFNIKWCTKLTKASLISILEACNKENAGVTITLPKVCPNLNAEVGADSTTTLETVLVSAAYDLELTEAWTMAYQKGYTIAYA